ncbi:MAG: PQQ-binding-like beta-propeller repeat protein [bacterium]|nr:PQQ-binding-like beta-propeller repeat protein [bacterium]
MTGAYIGDEFSVMFDGAQQLDHVAIIDEIDIVIRYAKRAAAVPGLPVRVSIWSDAGGFPDALIYSEEYALPNVSAATWFTFPMTTPVTIDAPKYHVSLGYGTGAVISDSLSFRAGVPSNNVRSNYYYLGWMDMLSAFGLQLDNWMSPHQCEVYTVCNLNSPFGGSVYLWDTPDPTFFGATLNGWAQRFVAAGPETLQVVQLQHLVYDAWGYVYSGSSTNGVDVMVMGDDGFGNPDGIPMATVNVPAGIGLFPNGGFAAGPGPKWQVINVDFSSFNLVVSGPYHLALKMTSDLPADGVLRWATNNWGAQTQTGGSLNFTAPGDAWTRTGVASFWADSAGFPDAGFLIRGYTCQDEFYNCESQVLYATAPTWAYTMRPAGLLEGYQKVNADVINRVDKIRVLATNKTLDAITPVLPQMDLRIMSDGGADPGAMMWNTIITPNFAPNAAGWTEVVIPGGFQVLGDFFVGYANVSSGTAAGDTLRMITDDGAGPYVNGGARFLVPVLGPGYFSSEDIFGPGDQENMVIEVDFCSVIIPGWTCVAADWPTNAGDYARTGHSGVPLSDAYCDLNIKWTYTDPGFGSNTAGGGAIQQNAPIIWDTFVVCVQNSKINILSLNTGLSLASFTGNVAPYYVAVSLVRSTPTIATIDVGGIPKPVLFYGGGSSMMAVLMEPGFPVLWDLRGANAIAKGYLAGEVASGFTNWSAPVVANIAGTDMVFFGTQMSQILAADAETGNKLWGTTLVSNPVRNLAFDGASLYTATIAAPPGIPDGDVYKLSAATGAIQRQLSVDGPLEGTSTLGSTNETFADQLALYAGKVYVTSSYFTPVFDDEGLLYILDAATFDVVAVSPTQHTYQGGGLNPAANIMMHATTVIVAGGSTWTSTPLGGTVISHNRFTGGINWISDGGVAKTTGSTLGNGFMTCEGDGTNAQIYLFNSDGYLSCFDAADGNEIFHRRIDHLSLGFTSAGAGGAISQDGIVVFGTFAGSMIALEKGADRGRLEIMDYTPTTPVSFGNAPSFPVTLPAIYTNTGCATVTGTYTIDLASNGSVGPGVGQWSDFDVSDRAASIADQLTDRSTKAFKGSGLVTANDELRVDANSRSMNRAALAMPPYINGAATLPLTVNPGDTFDIVLDVNQAILPRGPNKFYISFDTDDPDFFLNDVTADPEIMVTLVGGCLIDTTHLKFGAGSANLQSVANSGRLGTGDWGPTPGNFKILGDAASFYQGTYVYGVTRSRIALNSQDWWSGGEEADAWTSMQADQNRCNDDCKPALQTGVSLGSITTDGITYIPLTGNLVCKDYIDSVQVFDPDGAGAAAWNWLNFETAFFDNDSTMGLVVSTSTFGAVDVAAPYTMLNDVSVEIMKVKTRNGQELNNWKFGVGIDYDVVNPDTAGIDRTISTVFTYGADITAPTPQKVWGMVKLPFGGGCAGDEYTPLKNVKALARAQSMTSPSTGGTARGNGFADSSYFWMNQPIGGSSQGSMHSADDQDVFATFVEKSFAAGGDSVSFAIAHFAMNVVDPEITSHYAPLATLLNKWVGYGRGDINNDGVVNLADIIALADNVAGSGPGAIPFAHLGDVDGDGLINGADVTYLVNYYFHYGPCPVGKFIIQ